MATDISIDEFLGAISFASLQLWIEGQQPRVDSMPASCTQGLFTTANRRPIDHLLIVRHAVEVTVMSSDRRF